MPDFCDECGYDFSGHQAVQRCPECGLCYDVSLLEIQARPRTALIEYALYYLITAILGVTVFIGASLTRRAQTTTDDFQVAAWVCGAGIVLGFTVIATRLIRPGWPTVMTVNSDGLHCVPVKKNSRNVRIWPWKKFRKVTRWASRFGSPCLRLTYGGLRGFVTGGLFIDLDVSPTQSDLVRQNMSEMIAQARQRRV